MKHLKKLNKASLYSRYTFQFSLEVYHQFGIHIKTVPIA